jgi:hypothetical protein
MLRPTKPFLPVHRLQLTSVIRALPKGANCKSETSRGSRFRIEMSQTCSHIIEKSSLRLWPSKRKLRKKAVLHSAESNTPLQANSENPLIRLPDELLLLIFSDLMPVERVSLQQTCRRLWYFSNINPCISLVGDERKLWKMLLGRECYERALKTASLVLKYAPQMLGSLFGSKCQAQRPCRSCMAISARVLALRPWELASLKPCWGSTRKMAVGGGRVKLSFADLRRIVAFIETENWLETLSREAVMLHPIQWKYDRELAFETKTQVFICNCDGPDYHTIILERHEFSGPATIAWRHQRISAWRSTLECLNISMCPHTTAANSVDGSEKGSAFCIQLPIFGNCRRCTKCDMISWYENVPDEHAGKDYRGLVPESAPVLCVERRLPWPVRSAMEPKWIEGSTREGRHERSGPGSVEGQMGTLISG